MGGTAGAGGVLQGGLGGDVGQEGTRVTLGGRSGAVGHFAGAEGMWVTLRGAEGALGHFGGSRPVCKSLWGTTAHPSVQHRAARCSRPPKAELFSVKLLP